MVTSNVNIRGYTLGARLTWFIVIILLRKCIDLPATIKEIKTHYILLCWTIVCTLSLGALCLKV